LPRAVAQGIGQPLAFGVAHVSTAMPGRGLDGRPAISRVVLFDGRGHAATMLLKGHVKGTIGDRIPRVFHEGQGQGQAACLRI